jgi:Protein of unknown function (DUF3309)
MSIGTVLLIILVIFLLGGVGPWAPGGVGYGLGNGGIGVIGLILVVVLVLVLLGRL